MALTHRRVMFHVCLKNLEHRNHEQVLMVSSTIQCYIDLSLFTYFQQLSSNMYNVFKRKTPFPLYKDFKCDVLQPLIHNV